MAQPWGFSPGRERDVKKEEKTGNVGVWSRPAGVGRRPGRPPRGGDVGAEAWWLRPAEGAGEGPCGARDVGENRVCPRSLFTKAVSVTRVSVETASPCKLDTSDPNTFATGRHQAKGVRRAVLEACWSAGGVSPSWAGGT